MRTQLFCIALAILLLCPLASAQWVQTNGPYGGSIHSVLVSGANIFAATDSGVYRSTSNGANWIPVNSGLGLASRCVTCFGVSGAHLFGGIDGGMGGSVFLTTDNGTNWSATSYSGGPVHTFATSGTFLFVGGGTIGGSFRLSTDNGTSWTAAMDGFPSDVISSLAIADINLFAALACWTKKEIGGVYLSTNSGANWTAINTGLPQYASGHYRGVGHLVVSGTHLFAGTHDGVFLLTDIGADWTKVNSGLADTVVRTFAASGKNLFAGTDRGVFLSTNSGIGWTQINTGLTDTSVSCLAFNGTDVFAAANSVVWKRPLSEFVGVGVESARLPTELTLSQNYLNRSIRARPSSLSCREHHM